MDVGALYERLAPHLEVVKQGKSVMEAYGCYPPPRFDSKYDLKQWPLSYWRGPGCIYAVKVYNGRTKADLKKVNKRLKSNVSNGAAEAD